MLEIRFGTVAFGRIPGQVEVTTEWRIWDDSAVAHQGALSFRSLDTSAESLSDFIARTCVNLAGERRQSQVEIVLPRDDEALSLGADQDGIRAQVGDAVAELRFREEQMPRQDPQ